MTSSFLPAAQIINNISQSDPAVVTTVANHGYQDGLYVRIVIPYPNSMEQVNENIYLITVLGLTTFSIPVSSIDFDPFNTAPLWLLTPIQEAQVIPVAEINSSLSQAADNIGPNNPRTF